VNKVIDQVDAKTGEIMRGFVVYVPHRPKVSEGWFMGFQEKSSWFLAINNIKTDERLGV
jgi:hypothetical protein